MLWKELEQHFNIQYILALVSSETKEKVKKQKEYLEETVEKIEFKVIGREDLYNILNYQIPEIA